MEFVPAKLKVKQIVQQVVKCTKYGTKDSENPKGATANAILYTIVETARANHLNIYEYLKYLLTVMPNTDYKNHPEQLGTYLPWAKELPEECRLNHTTKKSFK